MKKKYAIIVDPYSSGSLLAPEFVRRGFDCVAVHSQPLRIPDNGGRPNGSFFFAEQYLGAQGVEALGAELLRLGQPVAVVAGTESGVILSDQLSEYLNLPGNDRMSSLARRDKFLMHEAVKMSGLASVDQCVVRTTSEALKWLGMTGHDQVVSKPRSSAGSDNVRLCRSPGELEASVDTILRSMNYVGEKNHDALLQEYIPGTEYVVDTISSNGRHLTINLCCYTKSIVNGAFLYRETRFLPPTGELAEKLIRYNDAVLDVLGIVTGPAHSEIILSGEGSPILVEVGARLHGGVTGPQVVRRCSSLDPFDVLVDAYVDNDGFRAAANEGNRFIRHATAYCFANQTEGIVTGFPSRNRLMCLASFFDFKANVSVGDKISKTVDLYSSPGWIVLCHHDAKQLASDLEEVKRLEAEGSIVGVLREP
ncbi:ATP-grasp domain-containing protein [Gluconacetobacter sacchari]|uniref:ATP-grasp domain-containing protein n=1 Tax=Gluconacetobacter sacchari TaxID=92759 RepID=A0A7W4IGK5_9PROT|nr:ATP-grasp domain-containing protein [Gluconacetobacter sacchari]MBB2162441.1 ATP-grasp domain-containing protein [Gluconacetobacter sacchari]